jgi:hypothetical protein
MLPFAGNVNSIRADQRQNRRLRLFNEILEVAALRKLEPPHVIQCGQPGAICRFRFSAQTKYYSRAVTTGADLSLMIRRLPGAMP